jgi:hypothetical protein
MQLNTGFFPFTVDLFISKTGIHDCIVWATVRNSDMSDTFFHAGKALHVENQFVIRLKSKSDVSVIYHEVNHIVFYILDLLHIEITSYNSEVFCYISQYLVKQICNKSSS